MGPKIEKIWLSPNPENMVDRINEDTPKGICMETIEEIYKEHSKNIWRNLQEYIRNIHECL